MVKLKINAAALAAFKQANLASANNASSSSQPQPQQTQDTPSKPPSKPRAPKAPKAPRAPKTPANAPTAANASPKDTPAPKSKKKSTKKAAATAAAAAAAASSSSSAPPHPPTQQQFQQTPPVFQKLKLKAPSAYSSPAPPSAPPPPPAADKPPRPKLKLTSSLLSSAAAAAAAEAKAQAAHAASIAVRTPTIKLKHTTKPAVPRKRRHEPGNGYDSEASDREEDPAIEENFVLRMVPGPDCDYLRGVIERKELNVTSDVWMKFLDPRKAVVNIRGHLWAAQLVDLPCIIEANKTLDKKNIFKVADISQMLLVKERITHEEELFRVRFNYQDMQYPHGITPPMQHARKRRFRPRISNRTIEAVETEVDRLLRDDEAAESSRFNLVDAVELDREGSPGSDAGEGYDLLGNDEYDDDQDADGEADIDYEYGPQDDMEMDEDTLANDLESALFNGDDGDGDGGAGNAPAGESETSDEDEEEETQMQPEPELDEETKEKIQQREKLREDIQDLEDTIETKMAEYTKMGNQIVKGRIGKVIQGLKTNLEVKMEMLAQLGA